MVRGTGRSWQHYSRRGNTSQKKHATEEKQPQKQHRRDTEETRKKQVVVKFECFNVVTLESAHRRRRTALPKLRSIAKTYGVNRCQGIAPYGPRAMSSPRNYR